MRFDSAGSGTATGLLLLASLAGAWLAPAAASAATVEGVVLTQSGPLRGARVSAYRTWQELLADRSAASSRSGVRPGSFSLELPSGRYYFLARGQQGQRRYVAYHGANPIAVDGAALWLPLMAVAAAPASRRSAPGPRLRGTVTFKGQPVAGAQVSLYSAREGPRKGLGLLTTTTATDGAFELWPQEGSYVAIARKRLGGRTVRPLQRGDLYCYFPLNPFAVPAAGEIGIELPCYPKQDVAAFLDAQGLRAAKRTNLAAVRFREAAPPLAPRRVIEGKVTDLGGRPLQGLFVMGYASPAHGLFQMHQLRDKPALLTETARDGSFRLEAALAERYTLVARGRAGGAPSPGERFGLYQGSADHAVSVAQDNTRGVPMVVSPVMQDASAGESKPKAPAVGRASYGDAVILDDTVWRGTVTVRGVVVVGRGATLTVEAGTTVRFAKVDRNSDGVGDGAIRILGRLLVRGSPASPVRFTSLEARPRPADWSYLLLFTARQRSVIEHARIEYAFTGLQAHFSAADVRDSVFRHNVEGIRFGRGRVTVEHNDIIGNRYGIRMHRVEDRVEIRGNRIERNEIGLFLVPSGQNIVDFSASQYRVPRARRRPPRIRDNSITGNTRYACRIGERFGYDLPLAGNWWGSVDAAELERRVFDKRDDAALGRAVLRPFLRSPVQGAGRRAP